MSKTPNARQLALKMVTDQLTARGITDQAVLQAMGDLPRHQFVPHLPIADAYADKAQPTAQGQTISQPYMVALMSQLLDVKPNHKILEIGTGSGYQTAILAKLLRPEDDFADNSQRGSHSGGGAKRYSGGNIVTIERSQHLGDFARKMLTDLKLNDIVEFVVGDGTLGWPPNASKISNTNVSAPASPAASPALPTLPKGPPYDRILVTAGAPAVPPALKAQLADLGRIVIPVGDRKNQTLIALVLKDGQWETQQSTNCRFVPLVGQQGWPENAQD
jgi:protein-L-isoaspartate(D-aspartate) O-methyltransferase